MIRVNCYVGRFRQTLRGTGIADDDFRLHIEQGFARASRDASGVSNLQVQVFFSRLDVSNALPTAPTDILHLQRALRLLVGSPPAPSKPRRIGLLLADQFIDRPSLLGLMFDVGFTGSDPPREGCALFLNAIYEKRSHQGANAYPREVRFTAMHELGHVFNLWHLHSPESYMASSGDTVFELEAFKFKGRHAEYLQLNAPEHLRFIEPGGTDFGHRADGFPQGADPYGASNLPRSRDVTLQISGPTEPFWFFEPIEIEVTLRGRYRRTSSWPDQLDPGYGNFTIWIEEPTGERRRYRTTKHFMQHAATLSVSAQEPFRRDISIFGQSGGYTFRSPGVYRIWATSDGWGRRVESNRIEVEVLGHRPQLKRYRQLMAALTQPRIATLLFYRDGRLYAHDQAAVREVLSRYPKTRSAAGLHYALGRKLGSQVLRNPSWNARSLVRALDHLAHSADSSLLNPHRREKSRVLIEKLQQL